MRASSPARFHTAGNTSCLVGQDKLQRSLSFSVDEKLSLARNQAPIRSSPVMQAPIRSRPVMLSERMFLEAVGSVHVLFIMPVLSVFFFSDLPDKGHGTAHPGLGQQTALCRPADFRGLLSRYLLIYCLSMFYVYFFSRKTAVPIPDLYCISRLSTG